MTTVASARRSRILPRVMGMFIVAAGTLTAPALAGTVNLSFAQFLSGTVVVGGNQSPIAELALSNTGGTAGSGTAFIARGA